jgi:hypothetical protein
VTVQWCILSEALNDSIHEKGPHAMCASYRDLSGPLTLHHNLFTTCRDRHPTLGSAKEGDPLTIVDFRNNVIYNWSGTANFCDHFVNAVNNYWRPGPETDPERLPIAMKGGHPCRPRPGKQCLRNHNDGPATIMPWFNSRGRARPQVRGAVALEGDSPNLGDNVGHQPAKPL